MVDTIAENAVWRIEFTHEELHPVATRIAHGIGTDRGSPPALAYKPPREPTLGAPEIIISILATAALKTAIVVGLHAIERALESQIDDQKEQRVQVVVQGSGGATRRFPLSLRGIRREALKEFIAQIASAVEAL